MIFKVHTIIKVSKYYNLWRMIFRIIVVNLLRRYKWSFKDVVLMYFMRVLGKKGHQLLGNMLPNIKELKLDI